MPAEGIHAVAGSGNQLLLLARGRRAKRQASPGHPFGYGRELYIYAFIVSIVLFSVGGLFALYEAYEKWWFPHGVEAQCARVPLVVLAGALVMEGRSLLVAGKEATPARGKGSWIQFIRTAKAPELPAILLVSVAMIMAVETKSLLLGESAASST